MRRIHACVYVCVRFSITVDPRLLSVPKAPRGGGGCENTGVAIIATHDSTDTHSHRLVNI